MIALDSNLFIYFLGAHPQFGEAARKLLVTVEQTSLNACASELVQYEVLSYGELSDTDVDKLAELFEEMDVVYKPVTKEVLQQAATLRRKYGCGALDAIHIAGALQVKATHFVTNDKQILSKTIPGIELLSLEEAELAFSK